MKTQNISFTQMSENCQVPVSSLKRQFHNTSLGIDKISYYCTFLNTDILQLSVVAKKLQHFNTKAIPENNNITFAQFPFLYDFIYMLSSLKYSVEKIQKKHDLSDQSISHYLRALEIMGYLKIIEKKRIQLKPSVRFITTENTPLDTLFVERFKNHQDKYSIRPNVCIAQVKLTEEQIVQLESNLYDQFITFHNQNLVREDVEFRNVCLSIVPGLDVKLSEEMPALEGNILQEVTALQNATYESLKE
ncbi:MAG: hypothetical protein JKY55_16210 [Aliivibrio sp.]|uniref:hypothetical protein n=1 Tax=Aliivibrio sp. TaxID=1872443 RepID=UPI001A3C58A7|nr:hypothetical protein [Aliivibrio sp.]